MNKEELQKNLSRLGVPLMETEEDVDVNKILADVVKSKDPRYWELFPVLLVRAAERGRVNGQMVESYLKEKNEREAFKNLLLLSASLYESNKLNYHWFKEFESRFSNKDVEKLQELRNYFAHNESFHFSNHKFDAQRLRELFFRYLQKAEGGLKDLLKKYDDYSLEFALSQVFSPKQKELFLRKAKGEPLSKTEKEYFSRTVKKKVLALANPELHRLAQRLLE
jgi:hypothetical protein